MKKVRSEDDGQENQAYKALLTLLDDGETLVHKLPKQRAVEIQSKGNIEGASDNEEEEESDDEIQVEDDNEGDCKDPFEWHFASADLENVDTPTKWKSVKRQLVELGSRSVLQLPDPAIDLGQVPKVSGIGSLKLKYRIIKPFEQVNPELSSLQTELAGPLFGYQDIFVSNRTWENAQQIQNLYVLHAMNHILKTRDRILKNNNRLSADTNLEPKDQGYTRPKVLFLVPTRNSAVKLVETIIAVSGLSQIESKKRFMGAFNEKTEPAGNKPEDFQQLFAGNTNDLFCLGIKFTRQAVKLYSSFYSSDIIVASPLGLRMIIGNEGDKKREFDFLSSIELMVVDQLDAIQMQSWENLTHIFRHANLMPKESHGCDFSRIRPWYLDQKAKLLRQTVLVSAYTTPEMSNLMSKQCLNIGGKLRCRLEYHGSMATIGARIRQVYHRLPPVSFDREANERFDYFTNVLLPGLLRGASHDGTLVFIPSYLDFVRVRNYMEKHNHSFVVLSEYTSQSQVSRGRTYFADGRSKIMLYSQRLHHFRRYNIKGCKNIVFYGLPDNPKFYQEIVRFLARTSIEKGIDPDLLRVQVAYSKWDSLKLERIVGSNRVGPLVEGLNDMYEFF
ncbi:U3 small nucleolar RNA-associated protein 25 [Wickerhamiella sorbophila]|uniref:U3 small nucleolar RNA-associated protein 25 n=1 Tax=Wickerhamiella sorbophila TaxID=45607 RepID=A0A2T0FGF6_9ASCO|nr:U3 small nucleolar RNA-associated protein 25 [Wickerhamiella sorbophila]PRT54083.1 U3 small nucleolar RNA-associated protein 25 [Wickerhamiella sorbophila]